MSDSVSIGDRSLTARIKFRGAELCSLIDPQGQEYIWQAGPQWPRHAPILFPIVGKLAGDRLRYDGQDYALTQHGFARDSNFALAEHSETHARFSLADDGNSRKKYPFAFRLDVTFKIAKGVLSIGYELTNPDKKTLFASIGAHPAFIWPLRDGLSKDAHQLHFSDVESGTIRRLQNGLLDPLRNPSPIRARQLALDESLFAADAMILDAVASRWVRFSAPGAEPIVVAWEGFTALGLWSKPGAAFLCIEPWYGTASPVGFNGEFCR